MPAERAKRAPARATAQPAATKRSKAPSAMAKIVGDSVTTLPPKVLQGLLKKELLPLVDAALSVEQQDAVAAAFRAAVTGQYKDVAQSRQIGYEARKKDVEKRVKALESDVRRDWKYGYEEQYTMMVRICDVMVVWCQDIFAVIVVERAQKELATAHKSLACMKGIVQKMVDCNSR